MQEQQIQIDKPKGRLLTCGDIHGAHKALVQCLERCKFNNEIDTLIQLGDVCDGFDEVYEVVEELLKIKNLIAIRGNHDDWFFSFLKIGRHPDQWTQGGRGTLKSYMKHANIEFVDGSSQIFCPLILEDIPSDHREFFYEQKLYHVDKERNTIFVHGGFNRHIPIEQNGESVFFWDRDLLGAALSFGSQSTIIQHPIKFKMKDGWKEVFLGHTTTQIWDKSTPIHAANVWDIDTGCGWASGYLTIMDVDTKEFWQSDILKTLYPGQQGR